MVLDGNPSRSSGKPVGAFYITASNDGNQFSEDEGLVIIFDSKCLECTKNGTRTCNTKVARILFRFLQFWYKCSVFGVLCFSLLFVFVYLIHFYHYYCFRLVFVSWHYAILSLFSMRAKNLIKPSKFYMSCHGNPMLQLNRIFAMCLFSDIQKLMTTLKKITIDNLYKLHVLNFDITELGLWDFNRTIMF